MKQNFSLLRKLIFINYMVFHLMSTRLVNFVEPGHVLGSLDPAVTRDSCRGSSCVNGLPPTTAQKIYKQIIKSKPVAQQKFSRNFRFGRTNILRKRRAPRIWISRQDLANLGGITVRYGRVQWTRKELETSSFLSGLSIGWISWIAALSRWTFAHSKCSKN